MNVYVRELSAALARAGVTCEVFTRAWDTRQPATIEVEPGLRVHHIPAGPLAPVAKELLTDLVPEFTEGVAARLSALRATGVGTDAIHANYWLSGLAGHVLKHELELPLVSTFHTLDRVKAEASPEEIDAAEPARRSLAETEVIACSDAILASCSVEAEQLIELYDADPARIEIVPPGVDHDFFAPPVIPDTSTLKAEKISAITGISATFHAGDGGRRLKISGHIPMVSIRTQPTNQNRRQLLLSAARDFIQ
jgi:D-inositol-3-phosphate glycosyltransferase